jgi:sec-independent protein translocase protein TatA
MFHMPSMGMMLVLAAFGLILFGKRLPEVGRSLGKGIVEFKKGLKGIEEEVDQASNESKTDVKTLPEHKFDPYTGKPLTPDYKFDPHTGKPIEQAGQTQSDSEQTVESH